MVSLPPPHDITLYLDGGKTVPYTPVDMLWQVDRKNGVALATMNKPQALNPLTRVGTQEMLFCVEQANRDDDIKAVVWTGAGRAFSAGASLKPRKGAEPVIPAGVEEAYRAKNMWWRKDDIVLGVLTRAFWDLKKISICAVNGLAVGGSANIALANLHDFVLCSTEAKFKYPFEKLGIVPEVASSLVLPQLVGYAKAKEILFLGEWFSAQDALRLNLITSIHRPDALMGDALALAKRFGTHLQSFALGLSKKLINGHMRDRVEEVLAKETKEMAACHEHGCALNAPGTERAKAKL